MGKVYDYQGNVIIPDSGLDGLEDLLPNRLLVWHDEFVGPQIDDSKWAVLTGRGSSNSNLTYSEDIDKVVTVDNGLKYRCIKDNPHPNDGIEYSSAFIHTNNLFEFRYGRIEAKIKFPNNLNHHTTFWTLGANSERTSNGETQPWTYDNGVLFPSCGEIDIAEYDNNTVGFVAHWSPDGFDESTYGSGGGLSSITSTPSSWHIYSCEWTETTITLYVDGVQKQTWDHRASAVNGWNPFMHPHYLMLNCIVNLSGTVNWEIAETEVAWVRVYAPIGVTEKIIETAISIPASASIAVGERYWLGTPTFTPSNPSDMTVNWKSHNEDIVTCYGGMLIGKSAGVTYVQAKSKQGCTALCKVTVS